MVSKKIPVTETALILPISVFIGLLICQAILSDRLTCIIGKYILDNRYEQIMHSDLSHSDNPAQSFVNRIYDLTTPVGLNIRSPENVTFTDNEGNTVENYSAPSDIFYSFHDYVLQFDKTADNIPLSITAYYNLTEIPYNIYFLIRLIFIISIITTFAMLIIFGIMIAKITDSYNAAFEDSNITSKNTIIHVCNEDEFRDNIIREATRLKRHGGDLSLISVRIADLDALTRIHDSDIVTMIKQSVLQSVIDNIRIFDLVAQFSNDNCIYICMIDSSENDTLKVASRFAAAIHETKFFINGHEEISIDINCGISSTHINKDDPIAVNVTFGEDNYHQLLISAKDALTYSEAANIPTITKSSDLP